MNSAVTRRKVLVGAVRAVTSVTASVFSFKAMSTEQPVVHDVKIKSFKFEPDHIQVRIGDTIRWTNEDLAPHTATALEFGWNTEELTKDQSNEIIVSKDMETDYFCIFHPHMKASFKIL